MYDMNLFLLLFLLAFLAVGSGCHSSKETQETKPSTPPKPVQPAAMTQSISSVEAVVENVEVVSGTQFNLKIFVVTAVPVGGRTNVIEPGTRLYVSPQYYADSTGKISFEDPRNKRILSLKSYQTGQSFKGKITINRQGGWNVIDVEEAKQ